MTDDDLERAGEFVLGTLPHAERLAFQARLDREPDLQAMVADWQERLSALNEAYAPVPAPDLLPQIEARLFPTARATSRRPLWHWMAGVATAAALFVGAVVLFPVLRGPEAQPIAVLGAPDAPLRFAARHDGDNLILERIAGPAPAPGEAHELWVIAPGAAPVSLGAVETTLIVAYPAPPAGWTLAVTLEPAAGVPHPAPTGPVVAAAEITS